jgi:hypothetical protein
MAGEESKTAAEKNKKAARGERGWCFFIPPSNEKRKNFATVF